VAKNPQADQNSPRESRPAPSAARVTRPPQGLAVNQGQELGLSDEALMTVVQEQMQRVPGPRMPRRFRPAPAAGLSLPASCAGAGCLLRDQFKRIKERCKGDKECIQAAAGKLSATLRAAATQGPAG
jgi:hypothetical protein